jgi:hypothetical protein
MAQTFKNIPVFLKHDPHGGHSLLICYGIFAFAKKKKKTQGENQQDSINQTPPVTKNLPLIFWESCEFIETETNGRSRFLNIYDVLGIV